MKVAELTFFHSKCLIALYNEKKYGKFFFIKKHIAPLNCEQYNFITDIFCPLTTMFPFQNLRRKNFHSLSP